MTDEEYFRKNYPDSCYGDKPLSPYWDYFQDGVEFGERESEEKIAELTEQNTSLLTSVENLNKSVQELEQKLEQTEKDLADYQFNYPTIKELQKENTELKKTYRKQRNKRIDELQKKNAELEKKIRCECTRCVYSDSPCIRSDYGVENDEDVCPNYENVFAAYTQLKGENAELEKKLKALEGQTPWKDIKDKSEVIGKLTAAKEIMKRFVRLSNSSRSLLGDTWFDTLREAEQFLKDSEVDK